MKKIILPIIILSIITFFLAPQIHAQTKEACEKVRARASYTCLTAWSTCYYPCIDQTKDVKACGDTCTKGQNACDKKVDADYHVCLGSLSIDKENTSVQKSPSPSNSKVDTQPQPSFLEFLGMNPYQTWLRLQEIVEVAELYVSGELGESLERIVVNPVGKQTGQQMDEAKEQQVEAVFGKDWRAQLKKINNDIEVNAWKIPVSTGESVVDVPGAADVKRYSWEANSGAVIRSNTWETVTFKEPVVTDDIVTRTVTFREGDMEVKVKNEKPAVNRFAVDANGFFDLFVIQTHFRMSYTPEKKLAVISVYEGEVEIKTKDGQTVKLKPDGDKPAVLVVSKKLSPVKLAIGGLALFAITGGIVWFLKRKTSG